MLRHQNKPEECRARAAEARRLARFAQDGTVRSELMKLASQWERVSQAAIVDSLRRRVSPPATGPEY
jgi:hypothetical protein